MSYVVGVCPKMCVGLVLGGGASKNLATISLFPNYNAHILLRETAVEAPHSAWRLPGAKSRGPALFEKWCQTLDNTYQNKLSSRDYFWFPSKDPKNGGFLFSSNLLLICTGKFPP